MAKNILYVVPSTGMGGAETFLLHTAEFHNRQEFRPVYACFREGPLVDRLKSLGHTVYLAPQAPRLSQPWKAWRTVRWLSELIEKENISLVHSTLAYGALFGAFASRRKHRPHFWFQHGPVSGWQDWLAGVFPNDMILVNSSYTANKQKALAGKNFTALRLGVSPHAEKPAINREENRAKLLQELPADTTFISTMICRPQKQKGIELWLEASAELRKRGVKAACILIGGTEPSQELANLAKDLQVPFLQKAFTPNPWKIAQGADALVCASIAPEGYGLTIVEALLYRVPAIAPREGGPLDILEHGKTGLFFEPRNAIDLANTMEKLAKEPKLSQSLTENAAKSAQENFLAPETITHLESIYRKYMVPQ